MSNIFTKTCDSTLEEKLGFDNPSGQFRRFYATRLIAVPQEVNIETVEKALTLVSDPSMKILNGLARIERDKHSLYSSLAHCELSFSRQGGYHAVNIHGGLRLGQLPND